MPIEIFEHNLTGSGRATFNADNSFSLAFFTTFAVSTAFFNDLTYHKRYLSQSSILLHKWIISFRDHPFKTSKFFRGEGSEIFQICTRIVVKKTANERGVGVKNNENLPMSEMNGPLSR